MFKGIGKQKDERAKKRKDCLDAQANGLDDANGCRKEEGTDVQAPQKRPEERFILCIDGGGMRGVIPMVILQRLEEELRRCGGDDSLDSYFDYIAGTSTGGLISLALTCPTSFGYRLCPNAPQVELSDILEQYMSMGRTIFPTSTFTGLRKIASTKYPETGIESMLEQWFGDSRLGEATVPTLVMSYDLFAGCPVMLKSYEDRSFLVRDAGRATSAAPTYFPPLIRDGQILVDGGVVANNPAIYAYIEAKKLYPGCERFHILSLSTAGKSHTMSLEDTYGLLSWVDQVNPMFSTAQKRTADYVLGNMPDVDYMRIDDPFELGVKMDDTNPETLNSMVEFAQSVAKRHADDILGIATKLLENKVASKPCKAEHGMERRN